MFRELSVGSCNEAQWNCARMRRDMCHIHKLMCSPRSEIVTVWDAGGEMRIAAHYSCVARVLVIWSGGIFRPAWYATRTDAWQKIDKLTVIYRAQPLFRSKALLLIHILSEKWTMFRGKDTHIYKCRRGL